MSYLNETGLAYFWGKIKAWANSVFALLGHTHPSSDVTAMTGYSMPASTGAISSGDTLNQAVGKLEKAVADGDISNVVHRTGDETVQGVKTFSNLHAYDSNGRVVLASIELQHPDLERGVAPISYSRFAGFIIYDKNATSYLDTSNRLAALEFGKNTDSNSYVYIKAYNPNTTDSETAILAAGWDSQGRAYGKAPSTDATRTDDADILTRDWIPKDARIVHTTGNETISGVKTFTSKIDINTEALDTIHINHSNRVVVPSTIPTNTEYRGYVIRDNAGRALVDCYHRISTAGHSKVWQLHNLSATDAASQFTFTYDISTDKFYLTGPATFDASDDSVKIPNTAWIRDATGDFACNAASATKLNTARTINGVSFDGTADITVADSTKLPLSGGTMTGNIIFEETATLSGVSTTHNASITMNGSSLNFGAWDGTHSKWVWYVTPSGSASFEGNASTATTLSSTLAVDKGGTGATTLDGAGIVTKTGDQTVGGTKTFTNSITVSRANPYIVTKETDAIKGSTGCFNGLLLQDKNEADLGRVLVQAEDNTSNALVLTCYKNIANSSASIQVELFTGSDDYFMPRGSNGTINLGGSNNRWKQVYAASSTISTSDEREKRDISPIPDEVLDAWASVEFAQFRFNDAFAEKGDNARTHSGLVAQRIERAFASFGLDASKYGLFCYDEWDAEKPQYNEKGELERQGREAGSRYALRYEEALCMEAACMRRENARLKKRVAGLEERLAALELKIS